MMFLAVCRYIKNKKEAQLDILIIRISTMCEASGETCEDLREEHRIPSYSGPPGPGYAGRCDDLCVDSSTVIN